MTKKQKHPEKVTTDLIIVGPMPFPWKSLKTYLNNPDSKLIFIDGGIKHWEKFKKKAPQLLKTSMTVGDGDSSQKVMTLKKVSQNTSDLGFLLSKLGKKSEHARFMLVGFLGGRLDHQLFNLGEITLFLKKFNQANSPSICMDDKIQFLSG